MSSKNEDLKTTITRIVKLTTSTEKGKKSGGTKIATITRDIPVKNITPFSI